MFHSRKSGEDTATDITIKIDKSCIKHKTSRQREYRYFSYSFRDNWDYRELDREERWDYTMKKYEEFVGREKLEEAVEAAWKSLRPDLGKIGVCNI